MGDEFRFDINGMIAFDDAILDATVAVLKAANAPRSAAEIHELIAKQKLFDFKAKDPVGIVRSAIRKHLRTHAGTPSARVRAVDKDRYALP